MRHASCKRELEEARVMMETDPALNDFLSKKSNHDNIGVGLRGVGIGKIRRLMERGVTTLRELVDSTDPIVKGRWKASAEAHFDGLRERHDYLANKCEGLSLELDLHNLATTILEEEAGIVVQDEEEAKEQGNAGAEEEQLPPLFSRMFDKEGYNCRVLLKSQIDSIVSNEFAHRKQVMVAKMRGFGAETLKMDFNYKIANKIQVWKGRGNSFCPHKCLVTTQ